MKGNVDEMRRDAVRSNGRALARAVAVEPFAADVPFARYTGVKWSECSDSAVKVSTTRDSSRWPRFRPTSRDAQTVTASKMGAGGRVLAWLVVLAVAVLAGRGAAHSVRAETAHLLSRVDPAIKDGIAVPTLVLQLGDDLAAGSAERA